MAEVSKAHPAAPAAPPKVAPVDYGSQIEALKRDLGRLHDRFGQLLDYLKGVPPKGKEHPELP